MKIINVNDLVLIETKENSIFIEEETYVNNTLIRTRKEGLLNSVIFVNLSQKCLDALKVSGYKVENKRENSSLKTYKVSWEENND